MPRGLAVLLSWTGARSKHLRAHEEIWHRIGFETTTVMMSIDRTFFPKRKTDLDSVVLRVRREIEGRERDGSMLACHAFSNGGAMMMMTLLDEMPTLNFDVAVYDSTPSRWIHPSAAPFVIAHAGLSPRDAQRTVARHVPHAITATIRSAFAHPEPPFGNFRLLRNPRLNLPRPELFVYSEIDRIISAAAVEDFASHRESLGCDVRRLRFQDTPHCAHYRGHQDAYASAVEALVCDAERNRDTERARL